MNTVVDDFGNVVNPKQLTEPQTGGAVALSTQWDLGGTGALTPARLRSILRGQGDLRAIVRLGRDIEEQDSHIFGDFGKRKRRILTREWDVHVPDTPRNKVAAEKAAVFVSAWLKSLNEFEEILLDLAEAISHVVACYELIWGTLDGVPVPVKFEWRSQNYLRLMNTGTQGARAMSANRTDLRFDDGTPNGQELWPGGWLIHVHKAKSGYLDRAGMPRILAAWFMVKHHFTMQNLPRWGEVYGIPPRIGKYDPQTITAADKAALWRAIRYMGQDAGGIIPKSMEIDLMEAATGNVDAFTKVAALADQYASKAILGRDVVASGGLNGGSGQNEANNAEVADDLNVADCKQLARTITKDLIWPVAQYFGVNDPRDCPQFRFDTTSPADRKAVAEGIKAVQATGAEVGLVWAHEQMQVPVPKDGDLLLKAPAPPAPLAPPVDPAADPNTSPTRGKAADDEPVQGDVSGQGKQNAQLTALLLAALAGQLQPRVQRDALDAHVDAMLSDWKPAMQDMLSPIQKAIAEMMEKGESLSALQARLPELLGEMDVTALVQQLAMSNFLGNLAGQAGLLDPTKPAGK